MPREMSDSGLDIGRRVKAKRIAAAIRSLGGGPAEAKALSDAEWLLADALSLARPCPACRGKGLIFRPHLGKETECLACHGSGKAPGRAPAKPPSEVTRALVIEYLSRPEDAPRDEDVPPRRKDEGWRAG